MNPISRIVIITILLLAGLHFICFQANTASPEADDWLEQTVIKFLQSHFSTSGEKCQIEFRHVPYLNPENALQGTLKVLDAPHQDFKGNVVIVVGLCAEDKILRKYPVSVKVRTFAPVLVARRNIDKFQPLNAAYFTLEEKETTRLKQPPVTTLNDIANMQAARLLKNGSILTIDKIEPIPAVHKGDIVTITIEGEYFLITAQGRARKSGGIGEVIPVVNLSSLKEISARIVDSQTVIIDY